jgi:hypothetical protein
LKKWHWVAIGSGLPAVFLWGGKRRSNPVRRLQLESGDIVVWGGPLGSPIMASRRSRTGSIR